MLRETTMKGKVLSILLALTLVFTMTPALALMQTGTAHAESEPDYLTFTAKEAGAEISLKFAKGDIWFFDGEKWHSYQTGTGIVLKNAGEKVSFKGKDVITNSSHHFTMKGKIAASGDVGTLTDGKGGSNVTLSESCYLCMFSDCTSLTAAPKLPAKTLEKNCYMSMFRGCTNLKSLPELPATTLAESCYSNMFYGCSNIKISDQQSETYSVPWTIPNAEVKTQWNEAMFTSTGGEFTGDPNVNTTYYQTPLPSVKLTNISATAITYGQTLADSTVTGTAKCEGEDVTGTWNFKEGTTAPKVSDSNTTEYTVVFTPDASTGLDPAEGKAKLTVNKKAVNVTGLEAENKGYDGTKDATLDYSAVSFVGIIDGDALTASAKGAFADKNVGVDKTVTISDITLGGADAANYSVSADSQTTATADITAKEVTFSGITANNKTYDGNTDVELYFGNAVFDGKIDGDKLTVTAKGAFKDAAAGENKTVTITDPQLGGADAANYKLAAKGNQTETTATITAAKSVTKTPAIGKNSIKISWAATKGAAKYIVYGNKCGKKNKFKKLATVKTNSFTLKKLNGKKLKNHTFYKMKAVAVDAKGNVLSKTRQMHITTGFYRGKVGDTKSVTLNAKTKTLAKGKTFQLKAKVKNYKGLKSVSHVAEVRYFSSRNAVAKVDSKGKITAKKAGKCTIYAMGASGITAQIEVTVTK